MVSALESYVFAVADVSGESNEHDYLTVQAADLNEAQEKAEQMAKEEYPQWGKVSIECLESESFSAEGKSYVCRRNKKNYKRTKIHPDWGHFGYPNAVCWNCMELECVKGVSRFDDPKEWGDDEKGPIRIRWEDADAESFSAEGINYKCLENGKTYSRYRTTEMNTVYGPYPYKACYNCYTLKCTKALNPEIRWRKRDKKAESFSGKNWRDASPDAEYQALAKLDPIRDGQYNQGIAHSRVIVNGYEQTYEKYIKPVMAEYPYIRVRMESPMRDNNIIYVLITEQRKVDEKPWPGGTWETIIDRKHTLAFLNSADLFYWYFREGLSRLNRDNDYDEVTEAHSENLIRLIFGKYLNEKYGWFDGADEWEEPYPLPEEVAVGAAESFSAEIKEYDEKCPFCEKELSEEWWDGLEWLIEEGGRAKFHRSIEVNCPHCSEEFYIHDEDFSYGDYMVEAESFSAETIKPMTIGLGLGIVALFLWGRNR